MTNSEIFLSCIFDGCTNFEYVKGLCAGHYTQQRRGKTLTPINSTRYTTQKVCTYPGCVRSNHSKGYCYGHYQQSIRSGVLSDLPPLEKGQCKEEGCIRTVKSKGLCSSHYNKWRVANQPKCSFEGCARKVEARGLCKGHGDQLRAGEELREIRQYGVHQSNRQVCTVEHCTKRAVNSVTCGSHRRCVSNYGVTVEWLSEHHKACVVCGETRRLTIDHDHSCCPGDRSCGECVRGVLCTWCNAALGHAKDSPQRLRDLANYLEVRT